MRRIVIDTNCLLAILSSRSPYHGVWTEFLAGRLEICVSNEILMEYDNKFVDCAVCGQAEYLVSNDKHFKILRDVVFPPVSLVTIQELAEALR